MSWLNKYKSEEYKIVEDVQKRLDEDAQACQFAKGLFDEYHEVTTLKENGSLNISVMASATKLLIEKGAESIFNATFSYGGLSCIVDILHREKGGYAVYKVITRHKRYIDNEDVAYQKYVLQKCGVNVTGTYVAYVDIDKATPDVSKLFEFYDVSRFLNEEVKLVEKNLNFAEKVLSNTHEPKLEIGCRCAWCPFWDYSQAITLRELNSFWYSKYDRIPLE